MRVLSTEEDVRRLWKSICGKRRARAFTFEYQSRAGRARWKNTTSAERREIAARAAAARWDKASLR
jgi:hypothetical protein